MKLKEYLINEITLDIDPNDNSAISDVRKKISQAKSNPDRANRDQKNSATSELKQAQASDSSSPTKSVDVKIAKLKQQLSILQDQKRTIVKRNKTQTESIDCPADICEIVYTDENDNVVHNGSILSESNIQAFKRTGNVIKRQYRCISGGKMGKIVANPNDCNKRKNPKSVKAGKTSARKNKTVRVSKTKISKNKSISKMVSSLNKRLKG